ncbi:MAG: bifunctional 5,10-methylenetetrahydrofolate dehydrogenase/5,10-methenyltetrahydrofolate cyclohydrolase [Oscillospiraceae bacterium]|nr:bifunctional 5,10-methylenetetrahydrofolate dehydrogenase/5,10-methenyltetrahydrofolate cyclohydrolase [Oscillospiraceae bacterium]
MAELTEKLKAASAALREGGTVPTLAVVRVGERDDDLAYERAALSRCSRCGVESRVVALPEDVTQQRLEDELRALGTDDSVHGILLLRPLPKTLDEAAACEAIPAAKDVDGVTLSSSAALYMLAPWAFAPCTAEACVELLKYYGTQLDGARVTVVGRSPVIGRPAALLLIRENATVTVAHTHTRELPAVCREADILIVAAGRKGLVGAEHVRAGQTVVDVGIHAEADGSLTGDVRFSEAEPVVRAITPVPGGVGSMTTAILCRHVIEAAKKA